MFHTKRGLLALIIIQAALIILLIIVVINLKIEGVGAQAGADYYRHALIDLHNDHEAVLRRIILQEREDLKSEYITILNVAVRHGVVNEREAASRIQLVGDSRY